MAFIRYRTKGVFLKEEIRSENDLFFSVYTKQFGKVEVLAKGIRKINSKLRASAQVLYLSEIEFIEGRYYKTLTDAILIDKFLGLEQDDRLLETGFRIVQTLDVLVNFEEPDLRIWQLLLKTLNSLNQLGDPSQSKSLDWRTHYLLFFWILVSLLGYQPPFSKRNHPLLIIAKKDPRKISLLERKTNYYFEKLKNN